MEANEFIKSCEAILDEFDGLSHLGQFQGREPHKMRNEFWNGLSGFDEMTQGMEDKPLIGGLKLREISFSPSPRVCSRANR
jgi:hypothetical protein